MDEPHRNSGRVGVNSHAVSETDDSERRRAERLKLDEHLSGTYDDQSVVILEVGLLGAQVEHKARFAEGYEGRLTFLWDEESIGVMGRIVRSEVSVARTEASGETTYLSGIEFTATEERDANLVKQMISFMVTRSLERMKANARGSMRPVDDAMSILATPAPFLDKSEHNTRIYVCCRLDASGQWHRAEVLKPKQPPDGFTVAADHDANEIELLCQSYEEGDEDARRMIRVCAEMAIASGEDVPPPSFV